MKSLTVCGAVVLLVALLAAPVAEAQFAYTTNNGAITITKYTGSGEAMIIPAQITGLPVTAICDWAFYSTGVINVTIPDTVTNIGDGAFFDCESLTNVGIGASVTSIGDWAFAFCSSLTNVNFRGTPPGLGGTNVFYGDAATVNYLPGSAGWGPTFGGLGAVLWNPPVPYSYTTNNSTITITAYIGSQGAVVIPSTINFLPVTSIEAAFQNLSTVTNVTIPDSVTSIGAAAFAFCSSLTSVTIPSGVTSIGEEAFYYCFSLTSVTIPPGVTNIGDDAFSECWSLTNVTIPGSVVSIGESAFFACFSLRSLTISNGVPSIGVDAFGDCVTLSSVTIPASVTNIAYGAFVWCYKLTSFYFDGNAPAADFTILGANPTVYYLPGTTGWSNFFATTGVAAVLWNPLIQTADGSFGVRANQFGFNITGTTNIPIVVQACVNLANPVWTPLQSLTLTNGSFYFSEPFQPGSPGRYYRITSQ